ncbi:MAG: LysR family transcriptional regulator [Lachnospiraceae bacterium]|nr:LysR family transcriptional regulator [Lachnospiraceae bacterium]
MDITQLKYFLTTAETLNYTRAAEKLFISRQALRQALTAMEKELGSPLFHNERNKLSLTAAGEYLRLSGQDVVKNFDEMMEGMQRFAKKEVTLSVAFSQSLFPFMMPETDGLLKRFQARYPAIRLKIMQMSNDEVMEALQEGRLDCGGVIQMPCHRPGMHTQRLTRYQSMVSYGQDHELNGKRTVKAEDLRGYPCLGMGSMSQAMMPLYHECQEKGLQIQYEVVPDAIEVFYRIAHENAVVFDVYKEDIPEFARGYYSLLEGYVWEIVLLCRDGSPLRREIQIFCRFLAEEYEKMKEEQRQSGILPPPNGPESTV